MAKRAAKKKAKFNVTKEVRKLARDRVGPVPSARIIPPKTAERQRSAKIRTEECE